MWKYTNHFIAELLALHKDISILAIVHSVPDWLYDHEGDVVVVGGEPPVREFRANNFHFVRAENAAEIEIGIRGIRRGRLSSPFELAFIKHDHDFASLKPQVNAALSVTGPESVFLFDDAVPPKFSMAGPRPTPGEPWFVGEVWLLRYLLEKNSDHYFADTTVLSPTGMMAAVGFARLEKTDAAYRDIRSRVHDDASLNALSTHCDPKPLFDRCDAALTKAKRLSSTKVTVGADALPHVESQIVDPKALWVKPQPQFILDLSEMSLDTSRLRDAERWRHGKFIDTFQNALVCGSDAIIKDGHFYCRNREAAHEIIEERARGYGFYHNFGSKIRFDKDDILLDRRHIELSEPVDFSVFLGTPDEYENWGMWMFLTLPSAYEFLKAGRSKYEKFLCHVQHPWQGKLLKAIGLTSDDIIPHVIEQQYSCREITAVRHSYRDLIVTPDDKQIFEAIRSKALDNGNTLDLHDRIFISRISRTKRHGDYRALLNEQALIDGLRPLGFQVIEPEYMSFFDQVTIFASAKIIVGLGGAAMFNTVFCRPDAMVIDIESTVEFVDAHTNIFGSLGLEYGVILGKTDLSDPRPEQKRWTLDIDRAVACISECI